MNFKNGDHYFFGAVWMWSPDPFSGGFILYNIPSSAKEKCISPAIIT